MRLSQPMPESAVSPFANWDNFYVIVGSSAAALTGLQFVVLTLIAQSPRHGSMPEIAAFGTPTVVHFCAAFLIAALCSAPWGQITTASRAFDFVGAAGIVYTAIVVRRAGRTRDYKPVFEDWLWHMVFPFLAYAAILGTALELPTHPAGSLFLLGGAALLLLFVGIHNAWDTVTFIIVQWLERPNPEK